MVRKFNINQLKRIKDIETDFIIFNMNLPDDDKRKLKTSVPDLLRAFSALNTFLLQVKNPKIKGIKTVRIKMKELKNEN